MQIFNSIKERFLNRFSDKINLFLLSTTVMSLLFSINLIDKNGHLFSLSNQMAQNILASILFCILILYTKVVKGDKNGENSGKISASAVGVFSAFAAYKIIYFYAVNITKIPLLWAMCFILMFALIFLCFYWLFKIVFNDDNRAIIVSLIIIFALNLQYNDLGMIRTYLGLIFYAGICALVFLDAKKIISFLKPFCFALIIFCILNGGYNIISGGAFDGFIKKTAAGREIKYTKKPDRDIYIIVLDAHAGKRTLNHLGINNSGFINKLKQRGFTVYEDMESNYNFTVGSIPSFLNVDYIQNLPYKTPSDAINNAAVLRMLKKEGYKIHYINSGPLDLKIKRGTIDFVKVSDENMIDEVAELFLNKTILSSLVHPEKSAIIKRAKQMQELFDYFDSLIKNNGKKRFVFAHFLMPHVPYVFDENGNIITGWNHDIWISKSLVYINKETYETYLKFADNKTLEFLDKIFALKREKPIIIVMGDHGARTIAHQIYDEKYLDKIKNDYKYLFNTFIAYYNPDYEAKYYKNTKSHINFMINFLNENFGANLDNVEDKHYYVINNTDIFKAMDLLEAEY